VTQAAAALHGLGSDVQGLSVPEILHFNQSGDEDVMVSHFV